MKIASCIEHTLLKPEATQADFDKLVAEAKQWNFFGVCVPPFWVKRAKREIGDAPIALVTVVGFPFGYSNTETKLEEIKCAIRDGADELDMVWNISAFKSQHPWPKIEIAKCANLVHQHQKTLKIIIETAFLSPFEIADACQICAYAGADFVKTSTGNVTGATEHHVRILRQNLPSTVGIKASGGIKTLEQAKAMLAAGADRLGTSSGIAILQELQSSNT